MTAETERQSRIGALLRPRRVAVVGASSRRATLGNQVIRNFNRWPLAGDLYVVHPTAAAIEGRPAVAAIADLPRGLDAAVVCLPAPGVAGALLELEQIGCRSAVAVAAGFAAAEARRLRELIPRLSLAVCGPNNMGVINATDAIALYTARFREPFPPGSVALLAQSGSAAIALVNTPGLAFSKVITSGNEWGLGAPDYLRWLAEDPATTAAGIVMESIRDGPAFAASARAFAQAGKRLVVLKVGRSEAGSAAAAAHTGALVGADAAYAAFFRREGIPVVGDYDELIATLQCFATPGMPAARGRRLAIVAISGGEGALAADVAAEIGVPLAGFAAETRSALAAALPGGRPENPLDLHASVGVGAEAQTGALRAVLADPGVDVLLVIQDSQHTLPIHPAHDYVQYLTLLRDAAGGAGKPVVVASTTSTEIHPQLETVLSGSPIPIVRGIREAVAACANLAVHRAPRGAPPKPHSGLLLASFTGPLPHAETARLLTAYGIPLVERAVVQDAAAALTAAHRIGYPLVVKVVSRQIPHRSDVGGVVLGVAGDEELIKALPDIAQRVGRVIEGYELQPMLTDVVEALVGFAAGPPFGGTVTVGPGGVLVELLGGHATELAPVTRDQAIRMISRTPLGVLLGGYRRLVPPTPVEPLADVICALSQLGADLAAEIAAVDLNPVLIRHGSGEAVVVDALMIASRGGAT